MDYDGRVRGGRLSVSERLSYKERIPGSHSTALISAASTPAEVPSCKTFKIYTSSKGADPAPTSLEGGKRRVSPAEINKASV